MRKTICRLGAAFSVLALLIALLFPTALYAADAPDPDDTGEGAGQTGEMAPPLAQVMLESYALGEADGDDTYLLTLTLANKGQAGAYNVLLSFEDGAGVFLPAYGTANQAHIAAIPAGGTASCALRLAAHGPVEAFLLTFSLVYRNPYSEAKNTFYIGSFTGHPADAVQILQMELRGAQAADGTTPVAVSVINRSSQSLGGLTLQVYSLSDGTDHSVPMGALEAGASAEETHSLQLGDGRIQQVRAWLSYEDENGQTHTTQESLFTLYTYQQVTDAGAEAGLLEGLSPYMTEIAVHLALIAAVLIALLVVVVGRRRRQARDKTKFW